MTATNQHTKRGPQKMGPTPGDLKVWFVEQKIVKNEPSKWNDWNGSTYYGEKHAVEEDKGQGQVMCRLYKLPNGFYQQHTWDLCLPGGIVERRTKVHSYVWLSPGDLHELRSNAHHYSDPDGTPGMVRLARTMLKALRRQTPKGIRSDWRKV